MNVYGSNNLRFNAVIVTLNLLPANFADRHQLGWPATVQSPSVNEPRFQSATARLQIASSHAVSSRFLPRSYESRYEFASGDDWRSLHAPGARLRPRAS